MKCYPSAGEAVIFLPRGAPPLGIDHEVLYDEGHQAAMVGLARTESVEEAWDLAHREEEDRRTRHEGNRARAGARARTRVRRYCKANDLSRLGTLTFRSATRERAEVVEALNGFFKRLRAQLGAALPYVWVIEEHKSGALHVHVGLGRPLPMRCERCDPADRGKGRHQRDLPGPCLACTWGLGFVHAKKIKGHKGNRASSSAATYLAKYVGKEVEGLRGKGAKAYEVGRGFQPEVVEGEVEGTAGEVVTAIAAAYFGGGAPSFVWSSEDADDWLGPPVRVVFFDHP